MSSTNRGYDRHTADYYVTPKQPVIDFLKKFVLIEGIQKPSDLNWLDPCCGGDENNDPTYTTVIKELYKPTKICGIDIREDSKADVIMNYLDCEVENMSNHNIIISNPPFYLAEEFIRKSLEFVEDGGYVIMLLRLNFFGSTKRKELFDKFMPKYCFIHHKRINFIPDSMKKEMKAQGIKPPSGDSIEYAHFVWQKGYKSDYTKTYLL